MSLWLTDGPSWSQGVSLILNVDTQSWMASWPSISELWIDSWSDNVARTWLGDLFVCFLELWKPCIVEKDSLTCSDIMNTLKQAGSASATIQNVFGTTLSIPLPPQLCRYWATYFQGKNSCQMFVKKGWLVHGCVPLYSDVSSMSPSRPHP